LKTEKQSDNTLLYTGVGLAAAAGAYYYFKSSDEPANLERKARHDEERIRVNARQTVDATKDRADDALQKGRATVNHIEDSSKEKYDSAKSQVKGAAQDAKAEGRGLFDKAEETLDSANKATREGLNESRERTEIVYRNVRDNAERKAAELRADADKGAQSVKEGWFSWLGYGKEKVDDAGNAVRDARDRIDSEAEQLRKETASKVARAAEDVRIKADKRA